jgi:chromosomal replication initiation ATPase DnaA
MVKLDTHGVRLILKNADFSSPITKNLVRIHALETVLRICEKHGVTFNAIISRSRYKSVVRARHHAWTLIRNSTDMSFPEIGLVWGGMDHTSIIHGVKQHESRNSHRD